MAVHAPLNDRAPGSSAHDPVDDRLEVGNGAVELAEERADLALAPADADRNEVDDPLRVPVPELGRRVARGHRGEVGAGELLRAADGRALVLGGGWSSARHPTEPRCAYSSAAASDSTSSRTAEAPPSPAARTTRLPTMTPSATSATALACSPVAMPKPTATGVGPAAARTRSTSSGSSGRQGRALAGGAGERHRVDEPARVGADGLEALSPRGGRHQRRERQAMRVAGGAELAGLVVREVRDDQPGRAGVGGAGDEVIGSVGHDRVGVDHEHHR